MQTFEYNFFRQLPFPIQISNSISRKNWYIIAHATNFFLRRAKKPKMSEEINSKIKWCKPVTFPGWYKKMSSNFRQFFKSQFLVDVIFHCEEGGTVGAHQTLLCHASPTFKSFKEIAG